MKVLITGANGQLGYALQKTAPAESFNIIAVNRAECDLANPDALLAAFDQISPDIIINAAAYTAVDKAESEPDLARLVNAESVARIARWCQQQKKILVQVSTDFVFDGKKSSPYKTDDITNPLSVYGSTKCEGEDFALSECESAYVVRTGWVYCEHGANFVKTILRLAKEREQLGIIADQIGTPTYAVNLAQMIWQLIEQKPEQKIWHFSDAGAASWYDFAVAIVQEANSAGLLKNSPLIKPIATSEYPTPAQRPAYSLLDKTQTWQLLQIAPIHWRAALVTMLSRLKSSM